MIKMAQYETPWNILPKWVKWDKDKGKYVLVKEASD